MSEAREQLIDELLNDIVKVAEEHNSDIIIYDPCTQDIFVETNDELIYLFTIAVSDDIIHEVLERLRDKKYLVFVECLDEAEIPDEPPYQF